MSHYKSVSYGMINEIVQIVQIFVDNVLIIINIVLKFYGETQYAKRLYRILSRGFAKS